MMRLLPLLILMCSLAQSAEPGGFLFVTFNGEKSAMGEQIYFGLSRDGKRWGVVNGGRPVLVSALGEKGVRDPFIMRAHDGSKFYLLATDLSIHNNGSWKRAVQSGSRSIMVWESADLVLWSEPRLIAVAAEDAGCTWAPEAVFDEQRGDYLVFWASQNRSDNFAKQRIWASRTKDFRTFDKPFIYIDKPNHVIDTTIVRDGDGYRRFSKDEQGKAITLETAADLDGPWQLDPGFSLARMTGYEGPTCFEIAPSAAGKPATWCLLLDHYGKGLGYEPFLTTDIASGVFTPATGFSFPFRFRHGTVMPISDTEYRRLVSAYGEATP